MLLPLLIAACGYFQPWGPDGSLEHAQKKPTGMHRNFGVKVAEQMILFHQNVISPVDGPRSHFRPTSSRYTLVAMQRYGFLKGFVMGCDRLMRENKEEWVYRKATFDNIEFKWDPTTRHFQSDKQPLTKLLH